MIYNSFNSAAISSWPIEGFSTHWWSGTFSNEGVRTALWTSVRTATGATAIALVLGTCAAFALQRYSFFGKHVINPLIVLPIALPGIVTGVALQTSFKRILEPVKGRLADTLREMREDLQSSISYAGGTGLADVRRVNYVILGGDNAGEHLLM